MEVWNDYELLYYIRQQSDVALRLLFEKYEKMLWRIVHDNTRKHVYIGMDLDDLMQLAWMTFYQCIDYYREDRNAGFSTFLFVCVERKIKSTVRDQFRGNSLLFLDSVSMDVELQNVEQLRLIETIENPYPEFCPVWMLRLREEEDAAAQFLDCLKPLDREIFELWRDGYSYREIAGIHDIDQKYIDNMVQKIRRLREKYQRIEVS